MNKQCPPTTPKQPVVLGKMGSSYGIRGWLRLFSSTKRAESIFDYQPWFIQHADQWQKIELEGWKRHNRDLIIKIKNVDDREAANLLANREVNVAAAQLPPLEAGDYYWKDLIGCQVVTLSVYALGNVIDMMETGSNDVMVVKANLQDAFGVKERLVPFLDGQVIKRVDLTTQRIEVDWDPDF